MEQVFSYIYFLCAWFGIALGLFLDLTKPTEDTALVTFWKFFSYYTGATNLLIAISITSIIFYPNNSMVNFFSTPTVLAATTFYIATVGIGNYVVFGFQKLPFWNQLADLFAHGITPAIAVFYWFLFAGKENLSYASIPYWLIYPLCYAAYTAIHGIWSKFYPYPFTNVAVLGWKTVGKNTLFLTLSVVVGSLIFISLGKLISQS